MFNPRIVTLPSGFLLGTRQTLLETNDGGYSWEPKTVASAEDEDFNYRFNSISFSGSEGWIIGKPAILLYSNDSGDTWQRIPLSSRLPGNPVSCWRTYVFPPKKSYVSMCISAEQFRLSHCSHGALTNQKLHLTSPHSLSIDLFNLHARWPSSLFRF